MKRLEAIRLRRLALQLEIERTRESARASVLSLKGMLVPVGIGLAAGQAIGGRPLLRVLGIAGVVFTFVRRWLAARAAR